MLQRDRNFDHYQDDGVYYDRRPSLWVEPKPGANGGWGKGAVQLVEIPTVDETFDNIVAFWNPAEKPKAGQELLYSYRLYWGTKMPYGSPLAQTIATRTGIGGTVGVKRQYYSWHFAVDFAGGELGALAKDAPVEAVVSTSRGQTEHVTAHFVEEFNGYRALFDVRPPDGRVEPIDLRLYLRVDGRPLTETWIYQWTPPTPRSASRPWRRIPGAPLKLAGRAQGDHMSRAETTTPPGFSTVTAKALAFRTGRSAAWMGITTSAAFAGTSNTPPSTG